MIRNIIYTFTMAQATTWKIFTGRPGRRRTTNAFHRATDWEPYKDEILSLAKEHPIKIVMDCMNERYNFKARYVNYNGCLN